MKFLYRLGFYLLGFSVGLIFLFFFLGKKGAGCDYSPNARVIKNIRTKPLRYAPEMESRIELNLIDTTHIEDVLHKGKVDFSESDTRGKPCNTYVIRGTTDERKLRLTFLNCKEYAELIEYTED